jgi:hypothetical protein
LNFQNTRTIPAIAVSMLETSAPSNKFRGSIFQQPERTDNRT